MAIIASLREPPARRIMFPETELFETGFVITTVVPIQRSGWWRTKNGNQSSLEYIIVRGPDQYPRYRVCTRRLQRSAVESQGYPAKYLYDEVGSALFEAITCFPNTA
jgi:hypothetical protein